ncbi:hypothetical protein V7128_27540 [Neobacillus vireti]|uniref:hypothetical protein n=1 Tax=Neobacillus vireti TaxID=220686 RepID=UPI002FFEF96A
MKKTFSLCLLITFILAGCSSPLHHNTVIDWVDFVKWDGKEYDGISGGVLANESFLGEKIGEVKFKVADNVEGPEYKTKDGDAAFHEKGTPIYTVKGQPNIMAVKSSDAIHGYRVYYPREGQRDQWSFQDMPISQVNQIEIYQLLPQGGLKLINDITNSEQTAHLIQLFKNSKDSPNFQPNTEKGDPVNYQVVFYTGEPIAYMQNVQFDGYTYYWFPNETSLLPNEIQNFFPE